MIPTQYEPKRNNRFVVEFPNELNIKQWLVQKIGKPKFTNGKWENIKIDFIDPIGPSVSPTLFSLVNSKKK